MEAKIKAEELIEKFQKTIYTGGAGHESTVSYNDIIQCAIVCVNEIIESIGQIDYLEQQNLDREYIFWNEVLTELNKM